jgi:2-phospho-L-lactate guanylyltransferase (CobY/MobA/RfbA family)
MQLCSGTPVLIWREAIQHTQVEAASFIKHSQEATEQKEKIPQTPWCMMRTLHQEGSTTGSGNDENG